VRGGNGGGNGVAVAVFWPAAKMEGRKFLWSWKSRERKSVVK